MHNYFVGVHQSSTYLMLKCSNYISAESVQTMVRRAPQMLSRALFVAPIAVLVVVAHDVCGDSARMLCTDHRWVGARGVRGPLGRPFCVYPRPIVFVAALLAPVRVFSYQQSASARNSSPFCTRWRRCSLCRRSSADPALSTLSPISTRPRPCEAVFRRQRKRL